MNLPSNSCAYEQYDPATLRPVNDSSYVRLIETGWQRSDFEGRSVLDIGCNSGLLSLYAHQLGAASVQSVDVQDVFVEFFSQVVKSHNLPIVVRKGGFQSLTPEQHGADVVLCMEVLHWVVDQGGTIPESIARLAALTGQTLYIETPWDVLEPSIAAKGVVTAEQYNIELILRELARHFEEVNVVRFMTYFGDMAGSKRVLIKAQGKRPSSLSLRQFRDANPSGIFLARGRNQIELVTTTAGLKLLKRLPQESVFCRLPEATIEALGKFLGSAKDSALVAPERIGKSYTARELDGATYMMFPFVGNIGDHFPEYRHPQPITDIIETSVSVAAHLCAASEPLVAAVRSECRPIRPVDVRQLAPGISGELAKFKLDSFLGEAVAAVTDYDRSLEDSLIHSDLQAGNFLTNQKTGKTGVVDLDLLRTGPRYTDILTAAAFDGTAFPEVEKALARFQAASPGRGLQRFDVLFSAALVLGWMDAIGRIAGGPSAKQLEMATRGMSVLQQVMLRLT